MASKTKIKFYKFRFIYYDVVSLTMMCVCVEHIAFFYERERERERAILINGICEVFKTMKYRITHIKINKVKE